MIIRSKAPLRLDFCGGGTDIAPFTDTHGGIVFNATINRYAYCTIMDSSKSESTIHSIDYNNITSFSSIDDLVFDGNLDLIKAVIKRMSKYGNLNRSVDIIIHSDAPPGSGLGSSSAVCVALVAALARYFNLTLKKAEIAKLAYDIERIDLLIPGGLQDQYTATYGGFDLMGFGRDKSVVLNPLRIDPDIINELLYHLVLIDVGKAHSDGILDEQAENLKREDVIPYYIHMKRNAMDMKDALLDTNCALFGRLLNDTYLTKQKICSRITDGRIASVYDIAMECGASAGHIQGAGGGGHMLFYVNSEQRRKQLEEELTSIGCKVVPFSFEPNGVETWVVL